MHGEDKRNIGMLREAIGRGERGGHPLDHVLNQGYGMMKECHGGGEFSEVGNALAEARTLDQQHADISAIDTILRGHVAPKQVSLQLRIDIKGRLLTQDELFDKLTAEIPESVAQIGEEKVRELVATSFKQGDNHERHHYDLYCEDMGTSAMLGVIDFVQPRIPKSNKAAVAAQLRAMADSIENVEG